MGGGASKSAQLYYADTLASSNAEIAKITAKLRYADTLASSNAEIAKIVQESASQTDRIPFYGTEPEDFREGEQVIVSFREYMAMGGKNWLRFRLQNTHLSPAVAFSSQMKRRRATDTMTSNAESTVVATFFITGRGWSGAAIGSASGRNRLSEHMAGGANSWLSPKRMAVLGGRKQEKCSSWRPKRFLTSQLPLSSLPEEFLIEETWGGGGAGSFGVTDSFGVTRKTSWIASSVVQYIWR